MRYRQMTSLLLAAAIGTLAAIAPLHAYPTKPVTMIVPFPPGGSTDIVGRIIADALSKELGQSVVVDNRGGAGGTVGTASLARLPADGYAIGIGSTSSHAVGPATLPKITYDPIKDFVPIALVAETPYVLAVSPKVDVKSVKELIALAKENPGKLNYGSAGAGSTTHLAGAMFVSMAGIEMEHVGYKGNAPATTALMSGEVEMLMGSMPAVLSQIKSGAIRAIAVGSANRSPELPDVPTVQEAGIDGFEASLWLGIVAPAGTPDEAVKRLQEATAKVVKDPEVTRLLRQAGAEPLVATPEAFAKQIEDDVEKYLKLAKDIGLSAN